MDQQESAVNLLSKVVISKERLKDALSMSSDLENESRHRDKDEIDRNMANSRDEPMFTHCTDSPNVMTSLRERAISSGEFVLAFSCAPHRLNNLLYGLD
jgi:hypothetical protein